MWPRMTLNELVYDVMLIIKNDSNWILEYLPCWHKSKFQENAIEAFDKFFHHQILLHI